MDTNSREYAEVAARMLPANFRPVDREALDNIERAATQLQQMLSQATGQALGFDEAAVRLLSDDLDANRAQYTASEEARTNIGWLYGCFLGKALLALAPGRGMWVDNSVDNYCIMVKKPDNEQLILAPFTRIFKQLNQGPEYSMFAFYIAWRQMSEQGIESVMKNR